MNHKASHAARTAASAGRALPTRRWLAFMQPARLAQPPHRLLPPTQSLLLDGPHQHRAPLASSHGPAPARPNSGPPLPGVRDGQLSFKAESMLNLSGSETHRFVRKMFRKKKKRKKRVFSLSKYASSGTETAPKSMSFREKGMRKNSQRPFHYSTPVPWRSRPPGHER